MEVHNDQIGYFKHTAPGLLLLVLFSYLQEDEIERLSSLEEELQKKSEECEELKKVQVYQDYFMCSKEMHVHGHVNDTYTNIIPLYSK